MKLLMENWNKFVNEELSVADEYGVSDEEAAAVSARGEEIFWGPGEEVWVRNPDDSFDEGRPLRKQSHAGMEPDYERVPEW